MLYEYPCSIIIIIILRLIPVINYIPGLLIRTVSVLVGALEVVALEVGTLEVGALVVVSLDIITLVVVVDNSMKFISCVSATEVPIIPVPCRRGNTCTV